MKRFKITIAYDGTNYAGWQEQKDLSSITLTLNETFKKVFKKDITVLGASRTDAGVHALGQIASFKTDLNVDPSTMIWAWNNLLPDDIHIRSIEHAKDSFHPHHNIDTKIYYYHVFPARPLPFFARFGLHYPMEFKKEDLESALQLFTGTHDFKNFCTEEIRQDTVRTIQTLSLAYIKRYNVFQIKVVGQKFLRHMIRRIVGAALAVASRSDLNQHHISDLLSGKASAFSLPCAPARGLMLRKIIFSEDGHE